MSRVRDTRPLVAHVVYRFDVGGLENGVVNLVNHMPAERYRHSVIALTHITDFKQRVERTDVGFKALNKAPGHGFRIYAQLYRLFRELRPDIVHTRNLAALEAMVPAWAAGVPVRIHGEHGWNVGDLDGSNQKYRWIRRLYRPFVTQYVALSRDLEQYVIGHVGVPVHRVTQICNGVDLQLFKPSLNGRTAIAGCPFSDPALWLVGTIGRMEAVKDQLTLARAFIQALQTDPALHARLRLVMIGGGPLRAEAQLLLEQAGVAHLSWLPGERNDIPELLRGFDCFVLPSLAEGVSNTILEAMASGLPVIATDVGGNAELIEAGRTGELVPSADPNALARAILAYARNPLSVRRAGEAGRARVERLFSLDAMVSRYQELYDRQLGFVTQRIERVGQSELLRP